MPIITSKNIEKLKKQKPELMIIENIKYIKHFQIHPEYWLEKDKLLSPVLKWVGGKGQILNPIFKHFPKTINNYYEPFVGGGSVFLELIRQIENQNIKLKKKIIVNDNNKDLIDLYKMIKEEPNILIKELNTFKQYYDKADMPVAKYKLDDNGEQTLDNKGNPIKIRVNTKNMGKTSINTAISKGKDWIYYHFREYYNNYDIKINPKYRKSSILLFLNKTCFKGLYREGTIGFNVPFGNYTNPHIFNKNKIKLLSYYFNKYDIEFHNMDFEKFCKKIKGKTDFVYLDPPYYPLKSNSFITYNKTGFKEEHHQILLKICQQLNKKGTKLVHNNSYCDWNIDKYKEFKHDKLLCTRRINSKNPKDTDYELIMYN
jgi:DNA adenine methylase